MNEYAYGMTMFSTSQIIFQVECHYTILKHIIIGAVVVVVVGACAKLLLMLFALFQLYIGFEYYTHFECIEAQVIHHHIITSQSQFNSIQHYFW